MAQCLVVPPTTRDGDGPYMCMHVNSVCIYIHPSWGGRGRENETRDHIYICVNKLYTHVNIHIHIHIHTRDFT